MSVYGQIFKNSIGKGWLHNKGVYHNVTFLSGVVQSTIFGTHVRYCSYYMRIEWIRLNSGEALSVL